MLFRFTGIGSETYFDWYIAGPGWTIIIALIGWTIALALDSLLGVIRTAPNRLVPRITTAYVEISRSVPLLIQLFIWCFLALSPLPKGLQAWFKQSLSPTTSAYLSVVVCLGLFTAAQVREQVRTGIQALPYGQTLTTRTIGFCLPQIYRHMLPPQTLRITIPLLISGSLDVLRNSSVASLISLMELLAQTGQTVEFSANLFEAFTLATLIYFTPNMSLMLITHLMEREVVVPGLISAGGK